MIYLQKKNLILRRKTKINSLAYLIVYQPFMGYLMPKMFVIY